MESKRNSTGQQLLRWLWNPTTPSDLESLPGRDHSSQALGITDLPPELLTEILVELSWIDLLRVRRVSSYLCHASKAKHIWQAIAQRELFVDSGHHAGLFLERPIEDYAAEELEYFILRWKSAEIRWKVDDGRPPRERQLDIFDAVCIHLVRGGRWLLVGTRTGSVVFYDLDQAVPTQRILISERPSADCRMTVSVDIDSTSPTLAFNLALAIGLETSEHSIEIWRVSLVYTPNLSTSTLVARLMTSFKPVPYGSIYDVSILDDNTAYSVRDNDEGAIVVVVVRWVDLEEGSQNFGRWVWLTPGPGMGGDVRLLPGYRILLRREHSIFVFRFRLSPTPKTVPGTWISTDPTYFFNFFVIEDDPYYPFLYGDSLRMVTAGTDGVTGLIIPYKNDTMVEHSLQVVKLGKIPPRTFYRKNKSAYGYEYSAFWSPSAITLIHHPWPREGNTTGTDKQCTVVHKVPSTRGPALKPPLMDIGAGRVVICIGHIIILDLGIDSTGAR